MVILKARVNVGNSNVFKILAHATCTIPDRNERNIAMRALYDVERNEKQAHPTNAPSYPTNPEVISFIGGLPIMTAPTVPNKVPNKAYPTNSKDVKPIPINTKIPQIGWLHKNT